MSNLYITFYLNTLRKEKMKIIGIPAINGLGKTIGTELAPKAVAEKLKTEIFLNESGIKPQADFEQIAIDKSSIIHTNELIEQAISCTEDMPIIIGGDHSITYSCFKAFSKKFRNPGIIVFDAHPDMENSFSPPTHEDYLRMLIEEGHVKPENVVLVATRCWDKNELEFMRQNRIRAFTMKDITSEGLHEAIDAAMSIIKGFGAVYVSIDIDAIDPAFAPGTGYIEPGGLTSREFLYFLHRLKNLRNLKAFDLVEINPSKDINGMTVKLGAKIVSEIFGYSN
jgi:arginase